MTLLCASIFPIGITRVIHCPLLNITLKSSCWRPTGWRQKSCQWWNSLLRAAWTRWFPGLCQGTNHAAVVHLPKSCSRIPPSSSRMSSKWGWNLPYLSPGLGQHLSHAREQHFLHHEVLLRQRQSWISFLFSFFFSSGVPKGFRWPNAFDRAPAENQYLGCTGGWKAGHKPSMCTRSPEGQPYPGLL